MLVFVIVMQAGTGPIKCDEGYYNQWNDECKTKKACNDEYHWYVFEKQQICVRVDRIKEGGQRPVESPTGTYACEGDKYLVYNRYSDSNYVCEATCVNTVNDCGDLYVIEDWEMCVDAYSCRFTYEGLTYIDGDTRKCVTNSECTNTYHRYKINRECITADECINDHSGYFPYKNTGECLEIPPVSEDNFTIVDEGYYCEQYLDIGGETATCVEREQCSGIPYDDKRVCLPDDEYHNWWAYRVYLLIDSGDRSYIDLDTCLRMQRYAYRYGECSLLAPDNSGGHGFNKIGDKNQVFDCSWYLLTLPDKVMCISYETCISKFGRVRIYDQHGCYTREQWISKNPRNYIFTYPEGRTADRDISELTVTQLCGKSTEFLYGRICVCQSGMYFYGGWYCASGTPSFNGQYLTFELEYSYAGHPLVFHKYYEFSSGCTSSAQYDGYVTTDHKCVPKCTGRYKLGEGRTCVCKKPGPGDTCLPLCEGDYVRMWEDGYCVPRTACARIETVEDEDVCTLRKTCDEGLFVAEDGASCTNDCEIWGRQLETNEKWCLISCESLPSDWPERPFLAPSGECVTQCEQTYDENNICRTCVEMITDDAVAAPIWDSSSGSCRACTAADGGELWDGECVALCPAARPVYEKNKVCTGCDFGFFKEIGGVNTCVDKCDDSEYATTVGDLKQCGATCESGYFRVVGGGKACVETCEEGADETGLCGAVNEDARRDRTGLIVGIAVSLALVAAAVVATLLVCRARARSKSRKTQGTNGRKSGLKALPPLRASSAAGARGSTLLEVKTEGGLEQKSDVRLSQSRESQSRSSESKSASQTPVIGEGGLKESRAVVKDEAQKLDANLDALLGESLLGDAERLNLDDETKRQMKRKKHRRTNPRVQELEGGTGLTPMKLRVREVGGQ